MANGARPAPTPFIGRESELTEVRELLGSERLVTLVGPGGAGKTRLAIEAAREAPAVAETVFVDLAPVVEPALIPARIAEAAGVTPGAEDPLAEVADRELLLLLDNCEHVAVACASIAARLLEDGAEIRILATSRRPLAIAGERTWPVPPMAIPDLHELPALQTLERYEGIRLFAARAAAAEPGFELSERNAPIVARICHRLDGNPLAIELAAARIRVLSVAEIDERLSDRFALLRSGDVTAPERQRSMRAVIDWSYATLDEPERALLRAASVFAGGFDLPALEAIAAGVVPDVLSSLGELVSSSLVLADTGGDRAVYRLLETIREYASSLSEPGDDRAQRHRDHFRDRASALSAALSGPEQAEALAGFDRAIDDIRAALAWTLEHDPGATAAFATMLVRYWEHTGAAEEGLRWLEAALATDPAPDVVAACRARCAAAQLAVLTRGADAARELLAPAIELARTVDDDDLAATVENLVGLVARASLDREATLASMKRVLDLRLAQGDEALIAAAMGNLAVASHDAGELAEAERLYEECLQRFGRLGNRHAQALAYMNLGTLHQETGKADAAIERLEEALSIFRGLGDAGQTMRTLINLGNADGTGGDFDGARVRYVEALQMGRTTGFTEVVVNAFIGFRDIAHTASDHERVVTLTAAMAMASAGFADAKWAWTNEVVAAAREVLGEEAFDRARRRGARMDLDAAIAYATETGPSGAPAAPAPAAPAQPTTAATFRREGDVWQIAFEGGSVRLRHAKGLTYLAALLAEPGRERFVGELASIADGAAPTSGGHRDGVDGVEGHAGEILDGKGRDEYKDRLTALREEAEEAEAWGDDARAERARDEIDQITAALAAAYGLAGRARTTADPVERMRKAVGNRIRQSIGRIDAEVPALGKHLRASIRTGTYCAYDPERPVDWSL